ncbi:MAG: hypothetical protein WC554_01845 [Clostridia bacterium]
MKQLTKDQAIAFANSRVWENWTDEQIVRFQLFQTKLCMDFGRFHEAMEKVLNRPIFTHEFGLNADGLVEEYLGTKPAPTLEEIINLIPEEKRIIIGF